MSEPKRTSPWVYVGLGCGCLILAGLIAIGAFGVYVARFAKQIEADAKDPVKRAARVQEVLGYEEVPEGYFPAFGFEAPFGVMEMAALADREPDEEGDLDESLARLFFYVRLSKLLSRDKDLQDILEGRKDPEELFGQAGLHVQQGETISGGTVTVGDLDVRFVSHRADLRMRSHPASGILTMFFVKCPEGQRPGLGGWIAPDPSPRDSIETADFTGSPADPETLSPFLSQFRLCSD